MEHHAGLPRLVLPHGCSQIRTGKSEHVGCRLRQSGKSRCLFDKEKNMFTIGPNTIWLDLHGLLMFLILVFAAFLFGAIFFSK